MSQGKAKQLWYCIQSFRLHDETGYLYAYTKRQAFVAMCHRMARKQGVHPSVVFKYFNDNPSQHQEILELEIQEGEEAR